MAITPVIQLSQKLIQIDSVTPDDKGCQLLIANLLENAGFNIEHKRFGEVDNLFAWHGNASGKQKSLMFLGHTDVVPTGDLNLWKHPPFAGTIDGNYLYGRGAADMKSAVAAFTLAMIDYVRDNPHHLGKVSLMLTSDEEGVAQDGVKKMMPYISKQHHFDYCLVGEPSSSKVVGDVVRVGRRGSLHLKLTIHGKQGHVAYPENAKNPVFLAAQAIDALSRQTWDKGNDDFPPTSFQISSIKTSTEVANIIPADLIIQSNFRYSPESDENSLKVQLELLLKQFDLSYSQEWTLSGNPFHSKNNLLKKALNSSIQQFSSKKTQFNTSGGTSDGRFVAPHGVDVVELGVTNKTIHQIDERVLLEDVDKLTNIYNQLINTLLKINN